MAMSVITVYQHLANHPSFWQLKSSWRSHGDIWFLLWKLFKSEKLFYHYAYFIHQWLSQVRAQKVFFLCSSRDWTQKHMYVRQALCHWATSTTHFILFHFVSGSHSVAQAGPEITILLPWPPIVAGITDVHHSIQILNVSKYAYLKLPCIRSMCMGFNIF